MSMVARVVRVESDNGEWTITVERMAPYAMPSVKAEASDLAC